MKEKYAVRLVGLLLATSVAMFVAAGACFAQYNTPSVGSGQLSPMDAPCRVTTVKQSDGTSETVIVTSAAYVSYIVMSTATADGTVFLTLRDTSTVNGSATTGANDSGATDVMRLYFGSSSQETVRTFTPPFLVTKGLTLKKSAASEWATVCVRTLFGQNP